MVPVKLTEVELLEAYWQDVGGLVCIEVPVGGNLPGVWPERSKIRRLDGVRFRSIDGVDDGIVRYYDVDQHFSEWVSRYPVEVIEAKRKLNRPVIGQVIVGVDMFQHQYEPVEVTPVIICGEGDPALELVCEWRRIRVRIVAV
jgi:hypothetical protein